MCLEMKGEISVTTSPIMILPKRFVFVFVSFLLGQFERHQNMEEEKLEYKVFGRSQER